jgi:hypothetical protein
VVDETTWAPTTYQGISIWGNTREGERLVDRLAQFKAAITSLVRREDCVRALSGTGISDTQTTTPQG